MADKSKMACNKPTRSDRAGKKKMVKACEGGKEKLIHFGAKGYGHNYSAAARKSFKARHKCGTAKSKLTARYWACKNLWAGKGGSTKSSPKNRKGKYQYICGMGKFKALVKKLMSQGKSETAAKKIAYSIGVNKYGKKGMARKAAAGAKRARMA